MQDTSYIQDVPFNLSTDVKDDYDTYIYPLNGACRIEPVSALLGGGSVPNGPAAPFFDVGENFSPVPFRLPVGMKMRIGNKPAGTCIGVIIERRYKNVQ